MCSSRAFLRPCHLLEQESLKGVCVSPPGRPPPAAFPFLTGCSLLFQTQLPSLTCSGPAVPFCQIRLCLCVGFPNTVSGKRSGSRSTTVLCISLRERQCKAVGVAQLFSGTTMGPNWTNSALNVCRACCFATRRLSLQPPWEQAEWELALLSERLWVCLQAVQAQLRASSLGSVRAVSALHPAGRPGSVPTS